MNLNVIHARQLVTARGPARARRGAEMRDPGLIPDGAIAIRGGRIDWVGPTDALPDRTAPEFDASGKIVLPGFVDSHTHAVFARTRVEEFEWRIQGASHQEILARGGGILSSTRAVRDAASLKVQFAKRFFEHGTTTIEAKSGYGLNLAGEIRMLETMRAEPKLEVVSTYLGAHALPAEFADDRESFIARVVSDLDTIAGRKLAEFCDVFVETGFFTPDEARRIFAKARALGLGIKLHADEFQSSGGAALAVELDATSADHLGAIAEADVQRLAQSGTIATLLPATLFMLGERRYAPARRLIDSGAAVALATDFNPGTSPTVNFPLILTLAVSQLRMSVAEAMTAVTVTGAAALGLASTVGQVAPGMSADLALFDVDDVRELPYWYGDHRCTASWARGKTCYPRDLRLS
jgi:imidazolonepropionase